MILFGLFANHGCKKPEDDLGLSVLDPADTLGTVRTDTISIVAWTRIGDSVQTSGLSSNEVGSYLDPQFGRVVTGTATQLRLSVNNVGQTGLSLTCDSLVLSLAYSTVDPVYGGLEAQTIRVYQLMEDLSTDSIYHSDRQTLTSNVNLVEGSSEFTPAPTYRPVIDGDSLTPQLRIPLSINLGQEMLAQWGQPTLADNTSFLAFFKGLYIIPEDQGQSGGGIWRFNLLSGDSKMTLYYHDGDGVSSTFDFVIGTSSVRYTHVVFDHGAATLPGVAEALTDSALGQQSIYLQSMGGLRPEVRFPYLDRYANTGLHTLAKAELIVPVANDDAAVYPPPAQLFPLRKDLEGVDRFLPDQDASLGNIGGSYDATAQAYRFNMTRWVQGIINGTYANTGLGLVPGSNGISVNRAVLAGPENPDNPMQLVLTFTTY